MSENGIKKSIDLIQLPKNQKELGREQLLEQYNAAFTRNSKDKKGNIQIRRFAIAAALALFVVSIPIYAASHYQLFTMFFAHTDENETTEQSVLEELAKASSSQQTSFTTKDCTVNVLSNVYCEEQNMGMVVCSIKIAEDSAQVFAFETSDLDGSANNYYVSAKGLICAGQDYRKSDASLDISDSSANVNTDISAECYFDGERTEDGAYLCGIRYTGICGASAKLVLVGNAAGDLEPITISGSSNLPKASGISAITYVSKGASKTSILISPFGMVINGAGSDADMLPYNPEDEGGIRNDIGINTNLESFKLANIATPQMTEEQDGKDGKSYSITNSFKTLVQVKKIKSITYVNSSGETIVFEKSEGN